LIYIVERKKCSLQINMPTAYSSVENALLYADYIRTFYQPRFSHSSVSPVAVYILRETIMSDIILPPPPSTETVICNILALASYKPRPKSTSMCTGVRSAAQFAALSATVDSRSTAVESTWVVCLPHASVVKVPPSIVNHQCARRNIPG
jgi:hypothetical protein